MGTANSDGIYRIVLNNWPTTNASTYNVPTVSYELPTIKISPLTDDKESMSFRIHVQETDEPGLLEVYVADSLVDIIETEDSAEDMTKHFQLDALLIRYYDDDHDDTQTELDILATINSFVARLKGDMTFQS